MVASGLESRQGENPREFDSPTLRQSAYAAVAQLIDYREETESLLQMCRHLVSCPACQFRNYVHFYGPLISSDTEVHCLRCGAVIHIVGVTASRELCDQVAGVKQRQYIVRAFNF